MEYPDYVAHLRQAAHSAGYPPAIASAVDGEAARPGLSPHEINHLAGLKEINWLLGYTRALDSDPTRTFWSLRL